ncbi:MAG: hypothetical protein JNK63_01205 [Chthonomonas sp.]|nr:hypothetical protein [Chthonomonas sp.]
MNPVTATLTCAVAIGAVLMIAPKAATINGKKYSDAAIVQAGKTYVSVESLKAAGAQVSNSSAGLQINFAPLGGRDQVDAVEGRIGEWIQNDLWRIRVESISETVNPFGRGPGLMAKIELRNLSAKPIAPYNSGMDKLQIIDKNQAVLNFSQGTFKSFFKDIAPGGAVMEEIKFGDQGNKLAAIADPEKLMIFFRATGGKKSKDFRVFLK